MRENNITSKLKLNIEQPQSYFALKQLILGFGAGILILGSLAVSVCFAPEAAVYALVGIGIGIPLLMFVWTRPELGLLVLIFLAASLVRADIVDLRLPVGGLELRDLVLIGMLGLLILQGLLRKNLKIPLWSVSAPLLIFLGLGIFSTVYALFFQHVESNWVFSELRAVIFYCVFFVTGWAITNRRQLETVLIGLFVIADLVAGVVLLQQFFGTNKYLLAAMSYSNWRVYAEQANGTGGFGMVRIMPPGVVLVYFMMIVAFCLMAFNPHNRRMRTILLLQFVFLNFGILLTYTRALWVAAVGALGLVLFALLSTSKTQLIRYIMIGLALAGLFFSILSTVPVQIIGGSKLVTVFVERILSMVSPEDTLESNSLQWRTYENKEGLRSISEHPLAGVGLGNSYRELTTLQGEAAGWRTRNSLEAGTISRFTRFIHNSYLYIAVKMGLPALACFLWFCVALVIESAQLYKKLSEGESKAIALAVLAGFIGLMIWSLLHEHLMKPESTAIIGLIAGLAVNLHRDLDDQKGFRQSSRRTDMRLIK